MINKISKGLSSVFFGLFVFIEVVMFLLGEGIMM